MGSIVALLLILTVSATLVALVKPSVFRLKRRLSALGLGVVLMIFLSWLSLAFESPEKRAERELKRAVADSIATVVEARADSIDAIAKAKADSIANTPEGILEAYVKRHFPEAHEVRVLQSGWADLAPFKDVYSVNVKTFRKVFTEGMFRTNAFNDASSLMRDITADDRVSLGSAWFLITTGTRTRAGFADTSTAINMSLPGDLEVNWDHFHMNAPAFLEYLKTEKDTNDDVRVDFYVRGIQPDSWN